jgi:sugar O-acyltransferase (sialic acid O-acetyltransferase NeuD family)
MIIVGAKGLAKEVLEICSENEKLENLAFYDDVNNDLGDQLFDSFPILKSLDEAKKHFKTHGKTYTLGLGIPELRHKLKHKFADLGGELISTVSPNSKIGHYGVKIGVGCNILAGSLISNDVTLGEGCILYFNAIITHDCIIGDFVEISPNVTILGRVIVGDFCQLGAGSIILPNVNIGSNVVVGAGAVVTKDVPDNCVVVGTPARIIRQLKPLNL